MQRLRKPLLWTAAAIVVLALLAWPKLRSSGDIGAGPPSAAQGQRGGNALAVTAYVVRELPLEDRIRATGTLRADESVDLAAEASGRVVQIHFREGSVVRRGQLLLKINDAELQAQRERVRHRIELMQTREERQRRLLDIGGVSQEEYDTALGEVNVLRADLAHIEAQIARTELRAPFAGVIGLRYVSEGAFVSPQTRVASLQAIHRMKLDFSIPERYSSRLQPGGTVEFTVAGRPGTYRGEVYAVEPRVDEETRALLVRALVANQDGSLMPGAFADIELIVEDIPEALPVPAIAVVPHLQGRQVWVMENGRAVSRPVETGLRTGNAVQITSGLTAGDTVLVSGLQVVRQGQAVRAAEFASLAPEAAVAVAPSAAHTFP
jgi:membrane fusion protein, multidrug efflux system